YYLFSALAELKNTWRSARGWTAIALFAVAYSLFAMIGSGLEILLWGGVLMAAGVPFYFLLRRKKAAKPARPEPPCFSPPVPSGTGGKSNAFPHRIFRSTRNGTHV